MLLQDMNDILDEMLVKLKDIDYDEVRENIEVKIYEIKNRPDEKPLSILVSDKEQIEKIKKDKDFQKHFSQFAANNNVHSVISSFLTKILPILFG